jgi:transcription antitermination factor NusG
MTDIFPHVTAMYCEGNTIEPNQPTNWFALYTKPRHEKWVVTQCESRGIKAFLPLYSAKRKWKTRTAVVELPLFPAYVFVHMTLQQRIDVITIPSVIDLVSFRGIPAALPESQIEALQNAVSGNRAEPVRYLATGQRVRISSGSLSGLEGIFVRQEHDDRIVVSIEWMARSVAIRLDPADIESLSWQ